MVASTVVALTLNGIVTIVGLLGAFVFSVYAQNASAGLFVANLTLVTGLGDFLASEVKAAVFGLLAGLVAWYIGLNVRGGPKALGDGVNQTVVAAFVLLFFANSLISATYLQFR
jgi:phospholipid/cholesterol/gamma-HCH transport system permease protein